jgi:phosphoglycerate dehydrogenase-like enzyme
MAPAVAEVCIGYAIALGRGIIQNYKKFLSGSEKYGIAENKNAYTLFNSLVGFIGFGNLAQSLVPLLKPFNCKISVYDPWLSDRYLETQGVKAVNLDEVLSTNKFLFILTGVTSENEGFLNKEKLKLIGNDSSVILVSRAEVVDFDTFIDLAEKNNFRAKIISELQLMFFQKNLYLLTHNIGKNPIFFIRRMLQELYTHHIKT